MLATLLFFTCGSVLVSVAGSMCTSCIVVGALFSAGSLGALFHHVGSLQMLISLISLSGLAIIAEEVTLSREERLRRAEELYRVLIETTKDGVWIIDSEHRTTFVNRRIPEVLGYTAEEIQGHLLVDFMFPEDVSAQLPDFLRPPHFREVVRHRFRRKDGSELWARVSAGPLLTKGGQLAEVMLIVSDVTLLCSMEDALCRNEKLITAGWLAATISHEINGPLETVANNLCVLRSEGTTEQGQQYLTLAQKEIQRVAAITKRTLRFFRDSSSWEELSLPDLLDDTISLYRSKLVAHSIRVMTDYGGSETIRGSRGGIQQVFANLISNAVDAMSSGGTLTVRVADATANKAASIRVEVEDTGKGIADLDLNRVFEPFFTTKQNGGTGLGLWVVKEIVEKHGGTVAVTSSTRAHEKCGARFSILLPRPTGQSVTLQATA
jgi:PAS domain S-box-containing protein